MMTDNDSNSFFCTKTQNNEPKCETECNFCKDMQKEYEELKNIDVNKEISDFIGTHESIISREMLERDEDIRISYTTWGHRAGCRAVNDILQLLDEETKLKVMVFMKNKRTNCSK
jgi:hypothetical protein